MFRFTPEGLVFAHPVTVELTFTGDGTGATILWSGSGQEGTFEELATTLLSSDRASAQVTHFSMGVVARRRPHRDAAASDTSSPPPEDATPGDVFSSSDTPVTSDATSTDALEQDTSAADAVVTDVVSDAGADVVADAIDDAVADSASDASDAGSTDASADVNDGGMCAALNALCGGNFPACCSGSCRYPDGGLATLSPGHCWASF
jgi:hypothetical protein